MRKLLITLLFLPALARAEFYTGNELFMKMNDTSSVVDRTLAMGYVAGVYDLGVHMFFCPPAREAGITVGQVHDMVRNWLYNNAQRRNELAQKLVLEVFRQAWPCANSGGTNRRGA